MIVALSIISIILFVYSVALSIIFAMVIFRSRDLMDRHAELEEEYNSAGESYAGLSGAYTEVMRVVSGPLFQQLERMRAADISLIHDNNVSQLYGLICNSHKSIYEIMSRYNLIKFGEPLPPYIESAKSQLEKKYLHAQISQKDKAQFRNLSQGPVVVGVEPKT